MSEVSKLQIYSIGIVAANKPLSSRKIEVTPIEDMPFVDGEISDNVLDTNSKATDVDGAAYETRVPTTITIEADWLPLGYGNRITAPDVRRGERVILYRFADQDKFWWVTQGQDLKLRKLETVIWGISATEEEGAEPGPDNMYWMEISSHKGLIHLHTSTANGEPYAYDLQLNAKDGTFIFQDNDGQVFSLDSTERIWRVENRDGSYVEVNKREITQYAPDRITLKTRDLVLDVENDMTTHVGHHQETVVDGKLITHTPEILVEVDRETRLPITLDHILARVRGEYRFTEDVRAQVQREDWLQGVSLLGHQHREQGDNELVSEPYPSTSDAWPWPTSN